MSFECDMKNQRDELVHLSYIYHWSPHGKEAAPKPATITSKEVAVRFTAQPLAEKSLNGVKDK